MYNIKCILSDIWQKIILVKDHSSKGRFTRTGVTIYRQTKHCLFKCFSSGFIVRCSLSHCTYQIQTSLFTTCCHVFLLCNELLVCSSAFGSRNTYFLPLSTGPLVLSNLIKAFVIFKSSVTKSTIILVFERERQVEACEYFVREGSQCWGHDALLPLLSMSAEQKDIWLHFSSVVAKHQVTIRDIFPQGCPWFVIAAELEQEIQSSKHLVKLPEGYTV